ncbi:glycosyltransferase family 25 protein [Moraxella cuniculi]|uniref:Glycosyltransferase family 25 (LPS biosynthesis protein) n=1 Tax=Moraxella cuniculi TaxID=34061 RepID=A0A448GWY6_9GAMM|nr:glycosyltransferase family 25 protein [Moraxella cuniculi]VEG13285.1 Glycosyltransferase family 25 (LPS biosynthesis protein) [Moraxella cuniculi]
MKVFIINLAQSTDRLELQKQQFDRLSMAFERLPATTVGDISERFYLDNIKHGQRLIKQTEMACFLSHKSAWEKVVLENQPCAILEDDAVLVYDFKQVLDGISKLNDPNIDLINLEVQPRNKVVASSPSHSILSDEYAIYQLLLEKNGTGGYVLFPSGAKKLLAEAQHRLALADAFIFSCPNLNLYQIEPAALLQDVICPAYDVSIKTPPVSLIGAIKNTVPFEQTLAHKIQFKKNRIATQLHLGIRTLIALSRGVKRQIAVDRQKFIHQQED